MSLRNIYVTPRSKVDFSKQRFLNKIEVAQYSVALAITNAIKGTSRMKLYKKLGTESLSLYQWFRRLCTFYKIKTQCVPKYV